MKEGPKSAAERTRLRLRLRLLSRGWLDLFFSSSLSSSFMMKMREGNTKMRKTGNAMGCLPRT